MTWYVLELEGKVREIYNVEANSEEQVKRMVVMGSLPQPAVIEVISADVVSIKKGES